MFGYSHAGCCSKQQKRQDDMAETSKHFILIINKVTKKI